MIVGVNGRFLVAKRTGVQRAAYNLLKSLVAVDRDNQYVIFTGYQQLQNPDWDFPNVKVIASNIREGESFRNHLWEQFSLPRLARAHKIDILHSPANMAPIFYRGKSIVHIHDLCFVVNPQWYSFAFHTLYNFVIPRLAKRATRIITNSNNSRNDLLQFCDVPSEAVSLIYWAVDDLFTNDAVENGQSSAQIEEKDYILYVGSLEPRKNIWTLFRAYEQLRDRRPDLKTKLILIGGESPLFAEVRLKAKNYADDIMFKGFVNDQELKAFYKGAVLVAYPSLYEGFGLPPLEAMACGTPVVTSNTSSIPEVVGDAAIMVNPYDIEQLAMAMERVIDHPSVRTELIRRGREQVRRFNWLRVARNTLAVYYEVHAQISNRGMRGEGFLPIDEWRRLRRLERERMILI
jgi:glycosyltransferase involved in cell wall biosynthesis